jgi:hypothetical protein
MINLEENNLITRVVMTSSIITNQELSDNRWSALVCIMTTPLSYGCTFPVQIKIPPLLV